MKRRRWLSFAIFSLAVPLAVRPAAAQLAPTGGHYANQPSDTGFTGGVNSSGGYSPDLARAPVGNGGGYSTMATGDRCQWRRPNRCDRFIMTSEYYDRPSIPGPSDTSLAATPVR
jgi:hypothetical protein